MSADAGGYVTDIPYLRDFKPPLAPAWLDHVALVCGIAPPARGNGFGWCDLGCGQGVTAAVFAATHPDARFYGIDLMPAHIDHARRLAADAGIANATFHAADFVAAAELNLPRFDYIVAHGVYTWIDEPNRQALRALIDRRLRPGGLVYLSYNALPGWAADLPVQHLLRAFHRRVSGDGAARALAAAESVRSLAAAGAPVLAASFVAKELLQRPEDYTAAYLVHEFMHAGFRPLYVTEMRAELAEIGLEPVGSATLAENDDALLLDEPGRALLAGIGDPDLRELVRDFLLDQRFRCDVFARGNRRLADAERSARLADCTFALARPAAAAGYAIETPRGRVDHDGPAARAVVAALAPGPRRLGKIGAELMPALLTLCASNDVIPVESGRAAVGALNRAIGRRLDGSEEIGWLALPCGTAIAADREILRALRDGTAIDERRFPGWPGFLAGHGVGAI
jgi:SAM-dependent methyltransferase